MKKENYDNKKGNLVLKRITWKTFNVKLEEIYPF